MEEKTIWIQTSVNNIDEKAFQGRPYTTKDGIERVPMLRGVTIFLGSGDEKRAGRIVVRDELIVNARNFADKDRPVIPGKYVFPLEPAQEYTVRFRKATGNKIPHPKTGEMINEWVNEDVKMTGKKIRDGVMENRKSYSEERTERSEEKQQAKEHEEPEEDPDREKEKNEKPKKKNSKSR